MSLGTPRYKFPVQLNHIKKVLKRNIEHYTILVRYWTGHEQWKVGQNRVGPAGEPIPDKIGAAGERILNRIGAVGESIPNRIGDAGEPIKNWIGNAG